MRPRNSLENKRLDTRIDWSCTGKEENNKQVVQEIPSRKGPRDVSFDVARTT